MHQRQNINTLFTRLGEGNRDKEEAELLEGEDPYPKQLVEAPTAWRGTEVPGRLVVQEEEEEKRGREGHDL